MIPFNKIIFYCTKKPCEDFAEAMNARVVFVVLFFDSDLAGVDESICSTTVPGGDRKFVVYEISCFFDVYACVNILYGHTVKQGLNFYSTTFFIENLLLE